MAPRVQQQGLAPEMPGTLQHPRFSQSFGQKLLISELFFQPPDWYTTPLVPGAGRGTSWTHRRRCKHGLAPLCSPHQQAMAGAEPRVHGTHFLLLARLEEGTKKTLLAVYNDFKSVDKSST